MSEQVKDEYLENAYKKAEELAEKYDRDIAYEFLMNIIHYRLNGTFKDK
jgi:hypothetical protein